VLLCHGFTGTPQSLRGWASYLASAGLTVSVPLLPGHGTTWQDMARTTWRDWYAEAERALADLRGSCDDVFVMGLSLGGCLALRLARHHPDVRGVVVVNPSLYADNPILRIAGVLKYLVRSVGAVGDDIKAEGPHELAYDRVPVRAAASLPELWALTRRELPQVTQPVLCFRSAADHLVGPRSVEVLRAHVGSELTERVCADSYHVATLDNDADMIFADSLGFVQSLTTAGKGLTE
jgi:carboxylesterase